MKDTETNISDLYAKPNKEKKDQTGQNKTQNPTKLDGEPDYDYASFPGNQNIVGDVINYDNDDQIIMIENDIYNTWKSRYFL